MATTGERKHPPGSVIFSGGEFLRFSGFFFSTLNMLKPPGSVVLMKQSVGIVENLNYCVKNMVGEWIHIQSDDHIWEPDALIKLLDREVDVIVPIILMRSPPFSTLIFKDLTDEGYMPFSFEEIPEKGMMEVFAAGTGGMTIRKNVLDAIGEPWFKYREGIHLSEDLYLCQRIREAGFKIWCDVEVRMGHRGTHTVYPIYEDGTWAAGLKLGDATDSKLNMISLHPKLEEK